MVCSFEIYKTKYSSIYFFGHWIKPNIGNNHDIMPTLFQLIQRFEPHRAKTVRKSLKMKGNRTYPLTNKQKQPNICPILPMISSTTMTNPIMRKVILYLILLLSTSVKTNNRSMIKRKFPRLLRELVHQTQMKFQKPVHCL